MGYTTKFEGTLKFTSAPSAEELALLETFFGEDPDDHPEWIKPDEKYSYLQYDLARDKSGLKWDGGEKFYEATNALNLIIVNMQASFPHFGLTGSLLAQGEEVGDVWMLCMEDGKAVRREVAVSKLRIKCPRCDCSIIVEEAEAA